MEFSEQELKLLMASLDGSVRQGGLNAAAQVLPLARKIEEFYVAEYGEAPDVAGEDLEADAPSKKRGRRK